MSNGTSFTKDSPALSAKDVCDIIKECRKSEVLSFEFQGLKIDFTKKIPENEQVTVTERQLPAEKSRDEMLNDALLADPGLYERLLEEDAALNG